jgi:hypothetical protein
VGWSIYLLQWCFDLTIGIILAAFTAGASALCSTILDIIPFVLRLAGIVTGHVALNQIKRNVGPEHNRAVWGLLLNYFGLFFTVISTIVVVILIAAGVGGGVLYIIFPLLHK